MPENVGKYNFSNTYISYFTLAASLGVTTYAVRECAKVKDSRETVSRVASEIFSINVCTMMISYAALFVSLILVSRLKEYRSLILILSSTVFFTIVGADWINTAFEDIRYITLRTFMFQAISLGLMFTIVRGKDDYVKYAMITAFSLCGANVLNVFYRRRFCDIKFVLHMNWRKHFPGIIMLFVMLFAQQIYCNSDITMLGIMRSNYEVGLYSLSVRIYTALTQVISSILWVLLPRLTERYVTKDYDSINDILNKALQYMIGLGLPCVVGGISLSRQIVILIGGINYGNAATSLRILLVALFMNLIGGSFIGNLILLSSNREKYFVISCVVAAVTNVGLNFVLIPIGGINAAAFTTLLSYAVIFVFLLPKVEKNIKLKIKDAMYAPASGAILIGIICQIMIKFISNEFICLLLAVAFSVVGYAVVLYLFKYPLFQSILNSIITKLKH